MVVLPAVEKLSTWPLKYVKLAVLSLDRKTSTAAFMFADGACGLRGPSVGAVWAPAMAAISIIAAAFVVRWFNVLSSSWNCVGVVFEEVEAFHKFTLAIDLR